MKVGLKTQVNLCLDHLMVLEVPVFTSWRYVVKTRYFKYQGLSILYLDKNLGLGRISETCHYFGDHLIKQQIRHKRRSIFSTYKNNRSFPPPAVEYALTVPVLLPSFPYWQLGHIGKGRIIFCVYVYSTVREISYARVVELGHGQNCACFLLYCGPRNQRFSCH